MPGTNLTRDEAATRSALIDVTTYDVELDLTGDGPTFSSRTVARFSCSEPGTSTFVDTVAPSLRSATLNPRSRLMPCRMV